VPFLLRLSALLLVLLPALSEAAEEAVEAEAEEEEEEPEIPQPECQVPDNVAVGAFVNNLQAIDLTTHTYEVDFYLWFRWCNRELDPATTLEFMNPSELWGMMVTPAYEAPEILDDGLSYQVMRVQGRFSTKMPLYDYPFDRQIIGPAFEDTQSTTNDLVYVADPTGHIAIDPGLTLPGYLVGKPDLSLTQESYPTSFGDPREADRPVYARGHVLIPLTRPVPSQLVLLLVPLMSVMVTSGLMFMLNRYWVDSRIAVGTTALLTIVALQITYNQEFADVGYLMLMDKVYLVSYLYVIVGLGVVVATSPPSYEAGSQDPGTARATLPALGATTLVYLVAVLVIVLGAALRH
jgi:hypothetical protein